MLIPKWFPFKITATDADTTKAVDTQVVAKTRTTHVDVAKDAKGNRHFVAHKQTSTVTKHKNNQTPNQKTVVKGKGNEKAAANTTNNTVTFKNKDIEWTAEETKQLKALKAEGKSWADIVTAMGRPKGMITYKWKELDTGGVTVDNKQKDNAGDKSKKQDGKNKKQDKVENANKKTTDGKAKDKQGKTKGAHAAKETLKAGSTTGEARFTMEEWVTLQEDDMFSFSELQCLSELIGRDDSQSWLRIASSFYDLTGRRVHPDDVKDKFEQMGAMI